jgi:hypothetical protein
MDNSGSRRVTVAAVASSIPAGASRSDNISLGACKFSCNIGSRIVRSQRSGLPGSNRMTTDEVARSESHHGPSCSRSSCLFTAFPASSDTDELVPCSGVGNFAMQVNDFQLVVYGELRFQRPGPDSPVRHEQLPLVGADVPYRPIRNAFGFP